eukprot:TRINITY_DN21139_c0_g1_i1.p1 TRINITY_DN21139_c0_g1~~TRINITY_DN21139_c0_g1_i1.p1  ORF type:complete len:295 (+),score=101.05 TRINITY_DN21139_c0_g1_i1:52-885(+)
MAICPEFAQEDKWEAFLERTDATKSTSHEFLDYSWSYGQAEDDDGMMRECVTLRLPLRPDTEPRHIKAKLKPSSLDVTVQGEELFKDRFVDDKWLSTEDSYWEIETKTAEDGSRQRGLKYLLYLRHDYPKYLAGALFQSELTKLGSAKADNSETAEDTVDARIRAVALLREQEPRRDKDVYFSDEEEWSDFECDGCGSRSVQVTKKAGDGEFKVYCNDCPYVAVANLNKEAPSLRRQQEVDEARARKKKDKERQKLLEAIAKQDALASELAALEAVD